MHPRHTVGTFSGELILRNCKGRWNDVKETRYNGFRKWRIPVTSRRLFRMLLRECVCGSVCVGVCVCVCVCVVCVCVNVYIYINTYIYINSYI